MVKFNYDNFSYQRYDPERGNIAAIRVPEIADNLYNVNYVMFQNTNFGKKWFYGFVRKINYINTGMTEIVYQIDVMQTWYFDYHIQDSFVVREHVNDDTKYKHYIEEGLDTGEYYLDNKYQWDDFKPEQSYTVIAASFHPKELISAAGQDVASLYEKVFTGFTGHLYNAVAYYAFREKSKVEDFIEAVTDAALSSGILTIFPFSIALWPNQEQESTLRPSIQTAIEKVPQVELFGSYKPKNNKLYCYPYSFIYVTNHNGSSAEFRYEFFTGRIAFAFCSVLSCAPDYLMTVMNYKQPISIGMNWNEAMGTGPTPYCSWITDTYRAYLAQNQSRLGAQRTEMTVKGIMGAVSGAASIGASALTGGDIAGGVTQLANSLVDTALNVQSYMAEQEDRERQPPQASSSAGNELSFALGLRNYTFWNMHITEEFARHIDEYFSMFGYKVIRVKKPNITGRRSWNYVKTENINIIGNVPSDDLALICRIYDNGITFWHTKDVGNYSLDNGIVGG